MKRLFDFVVSLIIIIIISPFLLPVLIILRFTGEGEVFYRQNRVGKDGKTFKLLKFATMLKNSPDLGAGLLTEKNDPRILPFGKLLRSTKINELPQLFNIISGDMSLVGPRPQAQKHFDVFPEHVKKEIIQLKPGLTGIGSIIFRDEESILHEYGGDPNDFYNKVIAPYKGELEIWYKNNATVHLNFLLLFLTGYVIFFQKSKLPFKLFKSLPEPPDLLKSFLV